jgi:predicted dehydrogenase
MVDILILGSGVMAGNQVRAFRKVQQANLVGVVSPHDERRTIFATEHGIAHSFATLEQALDWGHFDAATNVTPDSVHHATTLRLLAAGKHVLCEKPLAMDLPEAREMVDAADASGLVNMINFSYRDAAALQQARTLVLSGAVGEIRHVRGSYLQSWLVGDTWKTQRRRLRKLSSAHGSRGVLVDTGVHMLDFLTYASVLEVADLDCTIKNFPKVEGNCVGDYSLDVNDTYLLSVEMGNGAIGVLDGTRLATGHFNDLSLLLYGTSGALAIFTNGSTSSLRACLETDIPAYRWQDIECPPVPTIYQRFIAAILSGTNGEPAFRRGAEIQRLVDIALAKGNARRESGTSVAQ